MFYSGWKFRVPQSLDLSMANSGSLQKGGQIIFQNHPVQATGRGGVSTISILAPSTPALSRPARRSDTAADPRRKPFHVKTDAPMAPLSGLFYAEVQILDIGMVGGGGGRRTAPGLVVGVCDAALPSHRLPGEEAHSVGLFLAQRMMHQNGSRESTRVTIPAAALSARYRFRPVMDTASSSPDPASFARTTPPFFAFPHRGETARAPPYAWSSSSAACLLERDSRAGDGALRELGEGDAVGCLVNFADGSVQFTVNGYILPGCVSKFDTPRPTWSGYYFAVGLQRRTGWVRLQVILQSGVCPLPRVKVWSANACSRVIPALLNGDAHEQGPDGTKEGGTRNQVNGDAAETTVTGEPVETPFRPVGNPYPSIMNPKDAKLTEEVVILFDVAAYGRQIAEDQIRENYSRLFNGNWMESSFDDATVAVILQQYFSSRGMVRTMSVFLSELAEMRVPSVLPCAHSGPPEVEAVRAENRTKEASHSRSKNSSSPQSAKASSGFPAWKKEGQLPIISSMTMLEYTSEVETLRHMFMESFSPPSLLEALNSFPLQQPTSKTPKPSHARGFASKEAKEADGEGQGGVYPERTTDVLDYLLNHHNIVLPQVRCALASGLNTTIDSLDAILPSRFWALLFFSRRQDILFVIKALQVIDTGLDWVLGNFSEVRRQFSPQRAQSEGGLPESKIKGKHSNNTESDESFSTNTNGMFSSSLEMELIEQKLLMYYTNTVLSPFHSIKASERAAKRFGVRKFYHSSAFRNECTRETINGYQRRSESKNEEDCVRVASLPPLEDISWNEMSDTAIDECLLAHIQECRRVASTSDVEGGANGTSLKTAAPWEAVGQVILLGSVPLVAPPSSSTQIALGESLVTVVLHVMAFLKHALLSHSTTAQDKESFVRRANFERAPREAEDAAAVRKGGCGRAQGGGESPKEKIPHYPDSKAKYHATSVAVGMTEGSVVDLLRWVARWEALLQRAQQQYHKSAWALLQCALEEFNDRTQRRLFRLLHNEGNRNGVEPRKPAASPFNVHDDEQEEGMKTSLPVHCRDTAPSTFMEYLIPSNGALSCMGMPLSSENGGGLVNPEERASKSAYVAHSESDPNGGVAMDKENHREVAGCPESTGEAAKTGLTGRDPSGRELGRRDEVLAHLLAFGQPPLRTVYRRAHAVAALKPQQHIITCAFLAALEEGMRGLPSIGVFASTAKRSPSSSTALTSPSQERKRNTPLSFVSSLPASGAGYGEGGDGEIALEEGDWAVDEYYLGSVYLKRVYRYMFS
ncbi:unnamed protein product [Phytomonas sp. EM1]|nr:unnamed protein product [Phytomonas sp. EM1]|eukprot:CCW62620.1 unnamed protein product [Phytomonas sp. isolate EM1]